MCGGEDVCRCACGVRCEPREGKQPAKFGVSLPVILFDAISVEDNFISEFARPRRREVCIF